MIVKPEPCPFCGCEWPEKYFNGARDMASCPSCCGEWPAELWNRRPLEDALRAELARLQHPTAGVTGTGDTMSVVLP